MKILEKLRIETEKLLKESELVQLRGGYDWCNCNCYGYGYIPASNPWDCKDNCAEFGAIGICQIR